MSAYAAPMSIRKLFAMIVALAVLFAPGMTGAAMAAAPGHEMQMMQTGHCQMPPSGKSDHDRMADKNCCISMCMAVAVAPAARAADHQITPVQATFPAPKSYLGHLSEIATPPPRLA